MFLYVIENKVNGKKYVGITSRNIDERCEEHAKSSFQESHSAYNSIFHTAIRTHGISNFKLIFSQDFSSECKTINDLLWIESLYIHHLRTYIGFDDCNGYNSVISSGYGHGVQINSKSINVYTLSKKFIETLSSKAEVKRKYNVSDGSIYKCLIGETFQCAGHIFTYADEDDIEYRDEPKIYNGRLGKTYKIDVYDYETKKFIQTFNSNSECARELNLSPSRVQYCANNLGYVASTYIIVKHGLSCPDPIIYECGSHLKKKLQIYCRWTFKLLYSYNSITEASEELGIGYGAICAYLNRQDSKHPMYVFCFDNMDPIFDNSGLQSCPVAKLDENGKFLEIFESLSVIENELGIEKRTFKRMVKNNKKINGFHYLLLNEIKKS